MRRKGEREELSDLVHLSSKKVADSSAVRKWAEGGYGELKRWKKRKCYSSCVAQMRIFPAFPWRRMFSSFDTHQHLHTSLLSHAECSDTVCKVCEYIICRTDCSTRCYCLPWLGERLRQVIRHLIICTVIMLCIAFLKMCLSCRSDSTRVNARRIKGFRGRTSATLCIFPVTDDPNTLFRLNSAEFPVFLC